MLQEGEHEIDNIELDEREEIEDEQEISYVTDMIKNEYLEWEKYQVIFLNTPTGSGKTTFIIEEFLQYVINTNRSILYLVNRTMLKKQLENECSNKIGKAMRSIGLNIDDYVKFVTYQELEQKGKYNKGSLVDFEDYDYIIADEAHYFLTDSTYNTNTQISFDWIINQLNKSLIIYMSATLEEVKKLIINVIYEINYVKKTEDGSRLEGNRKGFFKEYSKEMAVFC